MVLIKRYNYYAETYRVMPEWVKSNILQHWTPIVIWTAQNIFVQLCGGYHKQTLE